MKIEIAKEEDRLIVAAILIKNGYRVAQGKERESQNKRTYTHYLEVERVRL